MLGPVSQHSRVNEMPSYIRSIAVIGSSPADPLPAANSSLTRCRFRRETAIRFASAAR
jgi:hypothetical protein